MDVEWGLCSGKVPQRPARLQHSILRISHIVVDGLEKLELII